jgi:plasmid stabilization system protein ParE
MGAEKRPTLTVVYSLGALRQLDQIHNWNEQRYSAGHADRYIAFLERHIEALSEKYANGRPIRTRPDLRYILIRRKSRGHGHVAVYRVVSNRIDVLYVFHSAQDWETKLTDKD